MRQWLKILSLGIALTSLGAAPLSVSAKSSGYCLECHSQKDGPPLFGEYRTVYQAKLHPCPGVRSLSEESFFTESRLFRLNQILQQLESGEWTAKSSREKISEAAESFLNLQVKEKDSVHSFSAEAVLLRAHLQKIYDFTLKARDESDRRWLVGLGSLIFLGLMILLGIGYHKLRQLGKMLLLLFFAGECLLMTSCSFKPLEQEKKSPDQQSLEQALSIATRSLNQLEENFILSSLLGEMAREWSKIESGPSEKAFQVAWQMALQAREKAEGTKDLWRTIPQGMNRQEALKKKIDFDTLLNLSDEIKAAQGRTWGLRLVAEQWSQVDEKKGLMALELASQRALGSGVNEYRDRDLFGIAKAWLKKDGERALEISRSIRDPFLKASSMTEIALFHRHRTKARRILQEAWEVAQPIPSEYLRSKALIQISAVGAKIYPEEKGEWTERVFHQIQKLKNQHLLSFLTHELVLKWASLDLEQAHRFVMKIPSDFPAIRANAYIHLAGVSSTVSPIGAEDFLRKALFEASRVPDSYEREKIRSLITLDLVEIDPWEALQILPKIEDPFYRSQILGQLSLNFSKQDKRKGLEFAQKIPLEAIRYRKTVEVLAQWIPLEIEKLNSLYQEAFHLSSSISDPFLQALALIELAKDWGKWDRRKGISLLDLASRSIEKISDSSKKAEAIESLAEAWKNFDAARQKKVLEGLDPSLVSTRKRLEEIRLWAKIDPKKAQKWAEAFPSNFPLERAWAFKEVAAGFKNDNPSLAFLFLEKAWREAFSLPQGNKRNKLVSSIVKESILLDRERTIQKLRELKDIETKDILILEAGTAISKIDPSWALNMATGISESSARCALYRKISEDLRSSFPKPKFDQPPLQALCYLGLAREKAKSDESKANALYEKALKEIEKIVHPLEKSYLLCSLVAEWSGSDDERALPIVEKIPSEYSEPYSYALLQVGSQLRRWSRKGAESFFQKVLSSSITIPDPFIRSKRLIQLANQWQFLNPEKGKEILKKAEREIQGDGSPSISIEKILFKIFMTQAQWEPEKALTFARKSKDPSLRAKILREAAKTLIRKELEEDMKMLNQSLQFAQTSKNSLLLTDIAVVWSSIELTKGLELLAQVGSKEIRVPGLRQMAKQPNRSKKEAKDLLRQATKEALEIEGLKEKVGTLKEIAKDWSTIDQEEAKAVYRLAYGIAEKALY